MPEIDARHAIPGGEPRAHSTRSLFRWPTSTLFASNPVAVFRHTIGPASVTKIDSAGTTSAAGTRPVSIVPRKRIPGSIVCASVVSNPIWSRITLSGFFDDWRCTIVVIDSTRAPYSVSGCASSRSFTRCPTDTRRESTSSTSPRAIMTATSSVSSTFSARQALSPTFFFIPSRLAT